MALDPNTQKIISYMQGNKNNVSKRLEDEDDIKRVAKTTKEELMYYLSPVYSEKQLKGLSEKQLMELLDEVIDQVYGKKRGGIIKDPSFNIYNSGGPVKPNQYMELQNTINSMSEEERKNLMFMLNQLLNIRK
tara:strand:- start:29 stop:427 length:399 start_codon:yes stop_codon:yes gene_type:complete